jgi:glycosyltransferase involved in cell wall biosynthesis
MKNILVSVIIPSYNHENFISKSILSVLSQKTKSIDIELIVIDDGSTDNSIHEIDVLHKEYDFIFIKNKRNLGLIRTLEIAENKFKGSYLCYLASDDFFLPGKIEDQINIMKIKRFDILYSGADVYDQNDVFIHSQNLSGFELSLNKSKADAFEYIAIDDTCGPLLQSAMIKSEIIKQVSAFRREFKSDDWVVMLYLLKNHNVGFFRKSLLGYRVHENNTHKNYWKMFSYRMEVIASYTSSIDEKLLPKAFSNLFLSHASVLFKNKKYSISIRFALASMIFGLPLSKIKRYYKRKFGL